MSQKSSVSQTAKSVSQALMSDNWIGRKLAVGVYMIFPLDETDVDDATRIAICGRDRPDGFCPIGTYDQLLTLARATAAKPVRKAALGVVLTR